MTVTKHVNITARQVTSPDGLSDWSEWSECSSQCEIGIQWIKLKFDLINWLLICLGLDLVAAEIDKSLFSM